MKADNTFKIKNTIKHQTLKFSVSIETYQESLANAKVSARRSWYIGRNSLNRLPLRIAQQYQRNLYKYIVEKYCQRWQLLIRFLVNRTVTQYDRLLASSCWLSVCLSVCLSVTLCILTLRVGVQG